MKRTEVAVALALVPCLALIACAQQAEQGGQEEQEEAAPAMEATPSVDMQSVEAAMSELETAWKTGYESGDAAAVAALYAEDAVYMAPYRDAIRGRAAVEATLTETMGMTSSRQITIQRTDIGAGGDLAYGIGTYAVAMQMAEGGGMVEDNGKYVTLLKRGADGSWKLTAHIWNTSLPEAQVAQMLASMNM